MTCCPSPLVETGRCDPHAVESDMQTRKCFSATTCWGGASRTIGGGGLRCCGCVVFKGRLEEVPFVVAKLDEFLKIGRRRRQHLGREKKHQAAENSCCFIHVVHPVVNMTCNSI
jgi:hypothetical protein